ncbi:hypothetical protein [Sulfolobus monocaudavirus SMV3]|uniref:hypothetical protein n=1 Tax=Sulfolobus monocaudavirus SMV3 TaxID=1732177 RepID=UPI0007067AB6|nr:hypothetical protein AXI69_gp57 [Sulfolobus monocaudavirus SMV3]ALG96994.1 hypothetical protein [Sulfolobus monocaudavirus SMV3]
MNPFSVNPPTIEMTLFPLGSLLVVVITTLLMYILYITIKKCESKITCREKLSPGMIELKSVIAVMPRFFLFFVVMTSPLSILTMSTMMSIAFVIGSLLGKIRSTLPADVEILVSFLFFVVNIILVHYFFSKYGSAYKLPFVVFRRNDIKQYFKRHKDLRIKLLFIYMVLASGSVTYGITIFNLLTNLATSRSIISTIDTSIVITLLLVYVIFNKKYENVFKLAKKIFGIKE